MGHCIVQHGSRKDNMQNFLLGGNFIKRFDNIWAEQNSIATYLYIDGYSITNLISILSGNLVFCINLYGPTSDQLIIAVPKYPIAANSQLGHPNGYMNGWSVKKYRSNSSFSIYLNTELIGHNLYTSITGIPRITLINTKVHPDSDIVDPLQTTINITVYDMGLVYF